MGGLVHHFRTWVVPFLLLHFLNILLILRKKGHHFTGILSMCLVLVLSYTCKLNSLLMFKKGGNQPFPDSFLWETLLVRPVQLSYLITALIPVL